MSQAPRRVYVFEPHLSGHHGPYLVWIAQGLARRGIATTVVVGEEHPSLDELREMAAGRSELRLLLRPHHHRGGDGGGALQLLQREWRYWRLLRSWHRDAVRGPALVFVPYLDYCLYMIGLLGSPFGKTPWGGLVMRPAFHHAQVAVQAPRPALGRAKSVLFARVLREPRLAHLYATDESLAEYVTRRPRARSDETVLKHFPEPAHAAAALSRAEAKRRWELPPGRRLVLCFGSLSARKGLRELLAALKHPDCPKDIDVLCAGQHSDSGLAAMLHEQATGLRPGRLRCLPRYLSPTEERELYAAADVVWLGYRQHYTTSGVLAQAAKSRRPVLACEAGLIGWMTRRHGLGLTVDPCDTPAVIAALRALAARSDGWVGGWEPPSYAQAQARLAADLGAAG